MPDIREECSFEADRFVESVGIFTRTQNEKLKKQASADALDLVRCMIRRM